MVELLPSSAIKTTETTTLALAAVLPVQSTRRNNTQQVVCQANTFDPLEVIDIQSLKCVVGCIADCGKWIFIEQLGTREVTQIGDNPENVVRPHNLQQR